MIIESIANSICSVFNKQAIEKLLLLNGIECKNPPKLAFGTVARSDLASLGTYLGSLADAGILSPSDPDLESWARLQADMPPVAE
jgi:phage gp29-like protein